MTPNSAVASASLLLLGTEVPPRDLDSGRLKRAFRRMALLTHPDTRRRAGGPDFLRVKQAFDELERYVSLLDRRKPVEASPGGDSVPGRRTAARAAPGPWYWSGRVPRRRLRLGEFLFYSGVISWDELIRAIVEQKGSRPILGQLARDLGLVGTEALETALASRARGEKLGETLVRLDALDAETLERLLAEQRRLQRPMGRHLARMGVIPEGELVDWLCRLWRHNGTAARRS